MASSLIAAGLGMAVVGFGVKYALRAAPNIGKHVADAAKTMSKFDSQSLANSKYYKGGFDPKMSKREASLILGISPNAPPLKLKAAYKKMILLNHPDKGGSPYLSAKISEAKDTFEKK